VLQGQLEGVAIDSLDTTKISTPLALRMFFEKPEHRVIEDPVQLLDEAHHFFQENPRVDRHDCLVAIFEYARQSGFE
jgi:hypothetical protein